MYNLTHLDLDGVVCSIILKQIYNDLLIKPVTYSKFYLDVIPFIRVYKKSIITDLNFDKNYYDEIIKSNNNILYVDHHNKTYNCNSTNHLKVINDEKYCASANLLSYLKKKYSFNDNIKKLVYYTNDYDLWKLEHTESQILNYIFWKIGFFEFYKTFVNGYDSEIVESYRKEFEHQKLDIEEYIRNCDKYEIENTGYRVLFIYCDKYINDITLIYPDYEYYFIVSQPYKISVRTKSSISLSNAFDDIQKFEEIETAGCHDFAGGINIIKQYNNEALIDVYNKIVEKVLEYGIPF